MLKAEKQRPYTMTRDLYLKFQLTCLKSAINCSNCIVFIVHCKHIQHIAGIIAVLLNKISAAL